MDHQARKMGFDKSNWTDIAKEAKKQYPNIDPTKYETKDIKGITNATKGRKKYGIKTSPFKQKGWKIRPLQK